MRHWVFINLSYNCCIASMCFSLLAGRFHKAHQRNRALRGWKTRSQNKKQDDAMCLQVETHNAEKAVRSDDIIPAPGQEREHVKGSGMWKVHLPSSFLRTAFSPPEETALATAKSIDASSRHATDCKYFVAHHLRNTRTHTTRGARTHPSSMFSMINESGFGLATVRFDMRVLEIYARSD